MPGSSGTSAQAGVGGKSVEPTMHVVVGDMPIAAFHTTSLSSNPVRAEIASAQLTLIDPGVDGAAPTVETFDWVLDPRWKGAPDMDTVLQSVAQEGPYLLTSEMDEYVEGLREISEAISLVWKAGFVLVIFDASDHLTKVENEFKRVFVPEPWSLGGPVVDPLVLDRAADMYRKGPRTLAHVCKRYGVAYSPRPEPGEDGAALAAARLAYVMLRRFSIEPGREPVDGFSLIEGKDRQLGACRPDFLMRLQADWARRQSNNYRSFLEAQAERATSDTDRGRLNRRIKSLRTGWPTLGSPLPELPHVHAKYHHYHSF